MKNKNFVFWILGPTSSGKTTIGKMLVQEMRITNIPAIHYDGDEIRSFFGKTLGFEAQDRLRAVSICAHLANKATDAGLNTVVSALTANDDARDYISDNVSNIILIYLKCPIEICIKRDSRGLYQGVKEGKIDPKTVIGLVEPYPPPSNPDLIIATNKNTPEESVVIIKNYLIRMGYNIF